MVFSSYLALSCRDKLSQGLQEAYDHGVEACKGVLEESYRKFKEAKMPHGDHEATVWQEWKKIAIEGVDNEIARLTGEIKVYEDKVEKSAEDGNYMLRCKMQLELLNEAKNTLYTPTDTS